METVDDNRGTAVELGLSCAGEEMKREIFSNQRQGFCPGTDRLGRKLKLRHSSLGLVVLRGPEEVRASHPHSRKRILMRAIRYSAKTLTFAPVRAQFAFCRATSEREQVSAARKTLGKDGARGTGRKQRDSGWKRIGTSPG